MEEIRILETMERKVNFHHVHTAGTDQTYIVWFVSSQKGQKLFSDRILEINEVIALHPSWKL